MGLYDLVGPGFVRSKTEGSELPHLPVHLGCCLQDLAGALLVWGMGENCRRDWGAWQPPGSRPLICRKGGAREDTTWAVSLVGGGKPGAAWTPGRCLAPRGAAGCVGLDGGVFQTAGQAADMRLGWSVHLTCPQPPASVPLHQCFTLCHFRRKLGAFKGLSMLFVVERSTLHIPGSQGQLAPCGQTLCICRT